MGFLGLSALRAAAFVTMMLIAIVLLGYVGWRIGSERGPQGGASPTSTPPPPPRLAISPCSQPPPSPAAQVGELYEAHAIELETDDISTGLAYLPTSRTLVFGQPVDEGTRLVSVTLFGDVAGSSVLPVDRADSLATGSDADPTLIVLDSDRQELRILSPGESGVLESIDGSVDLRGTGIGQEAKMDVDPAGATVVLVDPVRHRLLRINVEELARSSLHVGQVVSGCDAQLPEVVASESLLLAVRPTDGHVFLASPDGTGMYELDRDGNLVATLDLGDLALDSVRGMAFAPSADPTDAEEVLHLYVLAAGPSGSRIHALSPSPPVAASTSVPQVTGTVISRITTSTLRPPSSDPGGIEYDVKANRLVVTDSDIDELPEFAGHVVFSLEDGDRWRGQGQPRGSVEVTDVAVDAETDRWFFSDDRDKVVIQAGPGGDNRFGTRDDITSVISTTAFGNFDPEGIAFGQGSLFVTDGVGAHVYRLSPGEDGAFNGVPPAGDDEVTSFDTAALGISDPEGIAFDPERGTLYLLSRKSKEPIIEVATDGTLLTVVALERGALNSPGGITLAPALDGSERTHLFIADRGEDNAVSPAPNDGRIVEIQLMNPASELTLSRGALPPGSTEPA